MAPVKKKKTATAKAAAKKPAKKKGPVGPTIAQMLATNAYKAWLIKSEPFVYSFEQLVKDKRTSWDGVRNFEARNVLRAMKKGDTLLYYHSNEGKNIVGLARVSKEAYQDPTTEEDWSSVEVTPWKRVTKSVDLATIKAHPTLKHMVLVKRSRLSVAPVSDEELATILTLAETKTN